MDTLSADPANATAAAHQLDLLFTPATGGGTTLTRRRVAYPYSIQAPLRSSERPPFCHLILQSASGGLFGGERLGQRLVLQAETRARLDMPTAATVHAMRDGSRADLDIELVAETNAALAYLGRPLILFPESRVRQRIRITADPSAAVLIRDGFMTHDPWRAGGRFARLETDIELRRPTGARVMLDRQHATGDAACGGHPGIGGRFTAFGTILLARRLDAARAAETVRALEEAASADSGLHVAASPLRQAAGLIIRIAAHDGGGLDSGLARLTGMLQERGLAQPPG